MFLLAACAPTVQAAYLAPPEFEGPRFDARAHRFHSFDGAELGLSVWLPREEQPWAVIVGLHGMNDYGRTFEEAGPWFSARGVAVYAYDARGHGRSPNRGVWGGEALMTEDLRAAIAAARRAHPGVMVAVVGESMGAATAIAAFGGPNPPHADRLVLVAPAVWGWSTLPELYALTLWAGAHTMPGRAVSTPDSVARRIIPSDNTEMLRRIGRDPLMLRRTRIDAIYGLVDLMEIASERAPFVRAPTLFLYGQNDMLIPRRAAEETARALPRRARNVLYPNGWHMMLRDLQAEVVFEDILAFLRDERAPLPSGAGPLVQRQAASAEPEWTNR